MSDKKEKQSVWERIPFLQKLKNIKHIEIYLLCIFAIVLVIIYSTSIKSKNVNKETQDSFTAQEYSEYLERKLSNILSNISGAGAVKVMITLDGGMKYEYEKQSEEITTSNEIGGNTNKKTTKNEEDVIVTINGKSTPLIIKESYPDVCGVVVVASGATNVQVKLNIMKAIKTLLGIEEDNVQILVGND